MSRYFSLLLLFASAHSWAACPDPQPSNFICLKFEPAEFLTDGRPATNLLRTRIYVSTSPITEENKGSAEYSDVPISETEYAGQAGNDFSLPFAGSGSFSIYARATNIREIGERNADGELVARLIESELSNEVQQDIEIIDIAPSGAPRMIYIRITVPGA